MASSEGNPASLAEARSIMRSRATLFGSTGDAELARELRAAETTARAAEYTARAIMRSRANITSLDDEITARQMQAPDHSPAMAHLLAIARRDLAALEQERNNMMMRSIYSNSPQSAGLNAAHWAVNPAAKQDSTSKGSKVLFPASEGSKVLLPASPPKLGGSSYPGKTLAPLRQRPEPPASGHHPHLSRRAEDPPEPRNALAEIRANAELQIRKLRTDGVLNAHARLVLDIEIDPAPQVVKLGEVRSLKYQKVLRDFTNSLARIGSNRFGMEEFSVLQYCSITCKEVGLESDVRTSEAYGETDLFARRGVLAHLKSNWLYIRVEMPEAQNLCLFIPRSRHESANLTVQACLLLIN